MHADHAYFEEQRLDRRRDVKLLARLLPLAGRYRRQLIGSILLVFIITALDLVLPLLIKTAIDQYIVPRVSSLAAQPQTVSAKPVCRRDLTQPAIAAVVARYPDLFHVDGDLATIDADGFQQLPAADKQILRQSDLDGLARIAGGFVVLVLFVFGLNFWQKILMEYAGNLMMHDLRMAIFNRLQGLNVAYFARHPVGRLVTRVTNDIQNMHEFFTSVISLVCKDFLLLVGIAVVLAVMQWRLALAVFSLLPLVLVSAWVFSRSSRDIFRTLRVKVAQINTRFSEMIQGIRVVQLFQIEAENNRRFQQLNDENYQAGIRQIHVTALFMPLIEVFGIFTLAIIIYYGGLQVMRQLVTLGELTAFMTYMKMFYRPIRDLAEKYNIFQNAMSSAERIFQILDNHHDQEPVVAPDAVAASGHRQIIDRIRFKQVSFGYFPDQLVLEEVSFTVDAGQVVAFVGPTGAGKTSLIQLLLRFYEPLGGIIEINHVGLTQWPLDRLRGLAALVSQDPFIFSDTIRNNICHGNPPLSDAALTDILSAANCREFVERLPQGVDTRLEEGGRNLSSGQRQLISIARAFARNPQLIILDEATSYIDSQTEVAVQQAVARLMAGRTAVVVAHRLSTVRRADVIHVLSQGRVIESGSHDELMARQGAYYELYRRQG